MNELAEEVGKATGKTVRIKNFLLPEDDPKQRKPDITRAKKLLGWEPKVPLAEGLKKAVVYFANKIDAAATASE
jgi:UDP-glucuronate decarboxylase